MSVLPFKRRPVRGTVARPEIPKSRYYCVTCDTDRFVILTTGDVHCANCTAHIRNLFVHDPSAA
jgi:hypothetical protein